MWLIPSLGMSLVGGAVADTYNRRTIILVAQSVPLVCAGFLVFATVGGWETVVLIYGIVLIIGLSNAFESPARSAILPAIVSPETFANAVTVSTTFQTLGAISGSALGGFIIAAAGVEAAYGAFVCLSSGSLVMLAFLRYKHMRGEKSAVSIEAIKEGVRFVRRQQVLLGSMSLDMFAVIFGGATALLPVYANDILDVGPSGLGILTASLEAGAFLMSFVLLMRPQVQRTGRALIFAVVAFGIGTIVFGFSRNFYLSMAAYGFIGAADMISVVMRHTITQMATPDELRGRVSAVSQVFIGASNQLGAVESGFVAAVTSATFAVVSGGVGTLAVVGAVRAGLPDLWSYRAPTRAVATTDVQPAPTNGTTPSPAAPSTMSIAPDPTEEPAPTAGAS